MIASPFLWGALILVAFMVYGATGHDDPHGNLWFAHTFSEYGKFFNYNGDYVQQNTSLLQVIIVLFLAWIYPLDLITYGYLVDPLAAFFSCFLVTALARKLCPGVTFWPALLVFSSVSFTLWLFGGMGGCLAAFCLLLAVYVWWSYVESPEDGWLQLLKLLVTTLALVLVRPEFPFVIVAVALFLLFLHLGDEKRCLRFFYIFLVSFLGSAIIFIWQKLYFSSWFPLPIFAKISGFDKKIFSGFYYLLIYSLKNPAVILALLFVPVVLWSFFRSRFFVGGWWGDRSSLSLLVIVCSFFSCYYCFIWSVGGDWMQGGRFMVPIIPLASLLAVVGVSLVLRNPFFLRVLLVAVMLLGLRWVPVMIAEDNHGVPVWTGYRLDPAHEHYSIFEKYNQEHLRDMAVIDQLREVIPRLNAKLGRPVRLLSGQLGMVKYRLAQSFYGTGQVQFMDFRGIYDGAFVRCPAVLESVERSSMGLTWSYRQFFALWEKIHSECGIDAPDIIYDLDSLVDSLKPDFERAGYTLIHREEGYVLMNTSSIKTHIIFVPNIIYVKNELIPLLGNPETTVIGYKSIPLVYRPENIWQ